MVCKWSILESSLIFSKIPFFCPKMLSLNFSMIWYNKWVCQNLSKFVGKYFVSNYLNLFLFCYIWVLRWFLTNFRLSPKFLVFGHIVSLIFTTNQLDDYLKSVLSFIEIFFPCQLGKPSSDGRYIPFP